MAVVDGMLYVSPRANLTEADAQQIKDCKPFLLRLLATPDDFGKRLRDHLRASEVVVKPHIVEALERERILPDLDEYGVRLSMKMGSELYVIVSNARKEAFAEMKNGRAKLAAMEEE